MSEMEERLKTARMIRLYASVALLVLVAFGYLLGPGETDMPEAQIEVRDE